MGEEKRRKLHITWANSMEKGGRQEISFYTVKPIPAMTTAMKGQCFTELLAHTAGSAYSALAR